ncbi:hypothetical protein VPH35_072051 [Triticum aestivum]
MKIKKNPTQLQASRADRSWPQTRSPTQPCCCRFFLLLSRFPLPHPTPPPPPPTSSLAPRPSAPASTAIAAVPILSPSRSRSRSGQAVCRSATAYSSTQPTATDHPPPFLTWVVIHNPVVAEEESGAQPLAPRNPSLRLRLTTAASMEVLSLLAPQNSSPRHGDRAQDLDKSGTFGGHGGEAAAHQI